MYYGRTITIITKSAESAIDVRCREIVNANFANSSAGAKADCLA